MKTREIGSINNTFDLNNIKAAITKARFDKKSI